MINYNEDVDGFDFDEDMFDDKPTFTSYARIKRIKRPRAAKYANAMAMVTGIGEIGEDEHISAIVSGNFIAGDFIEAFLQHNNYIATELIVSTLSMSRENVDSLKNVMDFYLNGRLGLIISDFYFSHERRSGVEDIIKNLAADNFVLAVSGIHTKITLIKTECGKHFVIGGSANLRSSLNIEQITIDNSKILYDFNREWMATILNNYMATHKLLRREKLWQLVAKAEAQ